MRNPSTVNFGSSWHCQLDPSLPVSSRYPCTRVSSTQRLAIHLLYPNLTTWELVSSLYPLLCFHFQTPLSSSISQVKIPLEKQPVISQSLQYNWERCSLPKHQYGGWLFSLLYSNFGAIHTWFLSIRIGQGLWQPLLIVFWWVISFRSDERFIGRS